MRFNINERRSSPSALTSSLSPSTTPPGTAATAKRTRSGDGGTLVVVVVARGPRAVQTTCRRLLRSRGHHRRHDGRDSGTAVRGRRSARVRRRSARRAHVRAPDAADAVFPWVTHIRAGPRGRVFSPSTRLSGRLLFPPPNALRTPPPPAPPILSCPLRRYVPPHREQPPGRRRRVIDVCAHVSFVPSHPPRQPQRPGPSLYGGF